MGEQSPLRVRCKHGSLVVAGDRISLDPGPVRRWQPRWSVPTQDICALSASRGIGVTFTLTLQTTDGRDLRAEWLLPHDAQRIATALGYSLTLYDLHEMAAERELGTPFTYDIIALEPATPDVSTDEEPQPNQPVIQPVFQILPAGDPTTPPLAALPSIPALPPSLPAVVLARLTALTVRATALAAALWLALLAAVDARVRVWLARHPAPARVPSQPTPLGLAEALAILCAALSNALSHARHTLSPALAALQVRALRLFSSVHSTLNTQRDALREAMRASAADHRGARAYLVLLAGAPPRLRSRLASTVLVVALILAVIAASALQASPPSSPSHQGLSSTSGEVIGVLPRAALGGLSKAAVPAAHTSQMAAPTPTPTPTQPAVPPPPPPPPPPPALTLAITCAWAQDSRQGNVCVRTQPGAALTISIAYCDGRPAHNKSLQGTVHADSSGSYVWTWVPATRCIGPATAIVTAHWQGQTTTASTVFDVTNSALPPAASPAPVISL